MYRSVALSLTTLALLGAAGASTASATVFSGSGADPTGDVSPPTRDIAGVEAAYDDAGTVSASLTFAGEPEPLFVYLQVGTLSGTTCGAPFAALGGYTDATTGVWGISGDPDNLSSDARITRTGSKVTIAASGSRLSGGAPNCVTGQVSTKDGNTLYDAVDAPAGLTAQAAPTTTTPPTTPTPAPAPAPAPAPPAAAVTQQTAAASQPKKAAKLAVTVSGVPRTIKRNRTMSLEVKVTNTGTAAASGVTLKVGSARGLSVTPRTIKVKSLKAGKATTRRVKVKLTKKAKTTTMLSLRASGAKKLAASSKVALRIGTAKKPKSTKQSPAIPVEPTKTNPLAGTYWWYNINHVEYAWDNNAVYFLDDKWAYRGIPKGGLPTSCTTQTAGADEKGDQTDGCIPYTYDASSGAVTLGTAAGTFKDGKLQITDKGDLRSYDQLTIPDAGARYTVDLIHRGFQGFCGLITGCTTWAYYLQMAPDGQFVASRSSVSTMGDPGIGPFTAAGSYPPDEHGTYEVLAGGKIRLSYADGTVKEHTFAVQRNDAGAPDPATEGVFLDEDNYYKDTMP